MSCACLQNTSVIYVALTHGKCHHLRNIGVDWHQIWCWGWGISEWLSSVSLEYVLIRAGTSHRLALQGLLCTALHMAKWS